MCAGRQQARNQPASQARTHAQQSRAEQSMQSTQGRKSRRAEAADEPHLFDPPVPVQLLHRGLDVTVFLPPVRRPHGCGVEFRRERHSLGVGGRSAGFKPALLLGRLEHPPVKLAAATHTTVGTVAVIVSG